MSDDTLRCPVCAGGVVMWRQQDPLTRLEIDVCPSCHGVWFDNRELSTFLQSPTLKARFTWTPDDCLTQEERDSVRAGRRPCPRCQVYLRETEFAGVTLDFCPHCSGLWFDDGEVKLIVDRYQKGKRAGNSTILKELRDGLQESAGLFDGLRSFLKSARV